MRRTFFAVGPWLAVSCVLFPAHSLDAATIKGRVVDSAGQPVAGAEVRIWQKLGGPVDQPVNFDGGNVLHADAEGRFVSPDVLVDEAYARIVAEAEGMLAGRSGWIEIGKNAPAIAPDITLKGLRIVTGRLLDRRGEPVDGATVFNSGDGHERVEATSKGGGKFRLAGVPEGGVFLFAEKPGYRFTGVRLPADQGEAALTLTSIDEPAEPMTTLPPLLSPDEEYALAREVLDPWLERLAKSGAPQQVMRGFTALAQLDAREACRRFDWAADLARLNKENRETYRYAAVQSAIEHHDRIAWDELRSMIDSGDNEYFKAAQLVVATDEMDDGEQALRLEWLEAALPHARKVEDPALRTRVLAIAADCLFELGEDARARQILAEAEDVAKPPFAGDRGQSAFACLALAAAHDDADRAIGWLDKSGRFLRWYGGRLAGKFLPDRPQRAVEIWKRVAASYREDQGRTIQGLYYRDAAEFCYRLALVDRSLAEQIAADAEEPAFAFREKGGIFLALAETQPAEARRLLAAMVREELPQLRTEEERLRPLRATLAPAIAAWFLPLAEQAAPDLCRELLWRSLALRSPRPRRSGLNDEVEINDTALAMLLARYDRDVARALLEPSIARLPELVALAVNASAPGPVQVQRAGWTARYLTHPLFLAAIHIDPRWAKSLIDTAGDSPSLVEEADRMRLTFVYTLGLPLPDRWNSWNEFAAGFWAPSAPDRPLLP